MQNTPFDDLRARLKKHKGRFPEIAQRSGLSYSLICKLAQGIRANPTFDTVHALLPVLDELDAEGAASGPTEQVA